MFGGVQRSGYARRLNTSVRQRIRVDGVDDRGGLQGLLRHVEVDEVDHLTGWAATQVADDPAGHRYRNQSQGHRAVVGSLAGTRDGDIGDCPGIGRVPGILGVDERNSVIDIERVHHVTLSLVQIHRTRVHGSWGLAGLRASQHPTGIGFDDGDAAAGRAADVYVVVWVESGGRKIPIPAQSQETLLHQRGDDRFRPPPTHLAFRKRHFGCCAE